MKVAHWVLFNKSGMYRVAESMVAAEKAIGLDSHLIDVKTLPDSMADCDVHVNHTHFQDLMRKKLTKPLKLVWVGHGTPEHVFTSAVAECEKGGYGHGDGMMLLQHNLRQSDARVTFWPRHQAIYQSLCDKSAIVDCIPLGVDKNFWKPVPSNGKYAGTPSLFTAENCHTIKWPLDLLILWPWVYPQLPGDARLHVTYLPNDKHRYFFPLVNRNGASYASFITGRTFSHEELRNAFVSTDHMIGLVRYGDFNRLCLEAAACGNKVISYRGNPYATYWLTEGDQRIMADELRDILLGKTEPRKPDPVPDHVDTAKAMKAIYERILA